MITFAHQTPAGVAQAAALMAGDVRRLASCHRFDPHGAHPTAGDDCAGVHLAQGHPAGHLYGCPAREGMCHCLVGYTECIFSGDHNGNADVAGQS